jgi:hypothetical protein
LRKESWTIGFFFEWEYGGEGDDGRKRRGER